MRGALREGLGDVGRVGRTVQRKPDGALQVGRLEDRVAVEGLGRGEDLALEVERLGSGGRAQQLRHALGSPGDRDAAALLPAGAEAGLRLERLRTAALRTARATMPLSGTAQLPDEPGRVPGRAGGQLALLGEPRSV